MKDPSKIKGVNNNRIPTGEKNSCSISWRIRNYTFAAASSASVVALAIAWKAAMLFTTVSLLLTTMREEVNFLVAPSKILRDMAISPTQYVNKINTNGCELCTMRIYEYLEEEKRVACRMRGEVPW